MTMPKMTAEVFTKGVERKENFKQGYVRGAWYSPGEFSGNLMGSLPALVQVQLAEANQKADIFVIFSFDTPIAWFSLKDGSSRGTTNKWYFSVGRIEEKHDGHQARMRVILNAMPPTSVVKLLPNGQIMKDN